MVYRINPNPFDRNIQDLEMGNPYAAPSARVLPPNVPKVAPVPAADQHKLPAAQDTDFRTRIGKAIGAIGQDFADMPSLPPLPPMVTDNEAQRMQRLQMLRLPGYANGGYASKKKPIIVGEKGPEVFVPQSAGTVLPNIGGSPFAAPSAQAVGQPPQPALPVASPPQGIDWQGVMQADQAAKNFQPAPAEYYPNGVRKYAMDERLPDGRTVVDILQGVPSAGSPASVQPSLPTVTQATDPNAPNFDNFGWNSNDPAQVQANADYNLNRPPTVDEAWKNYNTILGQKPHPNKFLSGLFLALQAIGKVANPNDPTPVTTLADARQQRQLTDAGRILNAVTSQDEYSRNAALKKAQTENLYADNQRLDQQRQDLKDYRDATIEERKALRESRDTHVKMRMAQSMWDKLPSYDPTDPRFAELTKYLKDVNLPLTPKDIKKKVQMVQDADTGAWTLTLTNPVNGEQEVRPVTDKNGKPLVTTSTAKVQAQAAGARQQAGFAHDDQKQQALNDYRNAVLDIRRQVLELQKSGDTRKAEDAQRKEDTLKARLRERVKSGLLDQSDYDEIFGEPGSITMGAGGSEPIP